MGVAGSGKTLIGSTLAQVLGVAFVEGDDFHSRANVLRMASGIPLTDADRREWLGHLADVIRDATDRLEPIVLSCSALKRAYRDVLREAGPIQLIFLRGSPGLIADRLKQRKGHFMPESLLDSQFTALEEPSRDEGAWVCDVRQSPNEIIAAILEHIGP